MAKIKVKRVSTFANKFGTYAYAVVGELPKDKDGEGIEFGGFGKQLTDEGYKVIFSQNKIGELEKNVEAEYVVRKVNGVNYINLVDQKGVRDQEKMEEVIRKAKMANRMVGGKAQESFETNIGAANAGAVSLAIFGKAAATAEVVTEPKKETENAPI